MLLVKKLKKKCKIKYGFDGSVLKDDLVSAKQPINV